MILALKALMAERGITQAQLAEMTQTSPGYISLLVNNQRQPSPAMLAKVADVLGVSVGDLFGSNRGPGLAEPVKPFEPASRTDREFVRLLSAGRKGVEVFRMQKSVPGLMLARGDLIAVELGRAPATGDNILVTEIAETGEASTYAARWIDPWIVDGDPGEPPRSLDNDGTLAVLGVICGALRAPSE